MNLAEFRDERLCRDIKITAVDIDGTGPAGIYMQTTDRFTATGTPAAGRTPNNRTSGRPFMAAEFTPKEKCHLKMGPR